MAATRSASLCTVSRKATSSSPNAGLEKQQMTINAAIGIETHGKRNCFENILL
jgi:hypothetical protein